MALRCSERVQCGLRCSCGSEVRASFEEGAKHPSKFVAPSSILVQVAIADSLLALTWFCSVRSSM